MDESSQEELAAPNSSALGYGYPLGRAIRFGRSGVGDRWASAGTASVGSVHLCDLMERDVEELYLDGRSVRLSLRPFELVTLRFR